MTILLFTNTKKNCPVTRKQNKKRLINICWMQYLNFYTKITILSQKWYMRYLFWSVCLNWILNHFYFHIYFIQFDILCRLSRTWQFHNHRICTNCRIWTHFVYILTFHYWCIIFTTLQILIMNCLIILYPRKASAVKNSYSIQYW